MTNDEVIRRGHGSPQARWPEECCSNGDCPICNPAAEDEDEEIDL
jgi:hypothetical protein